MNFDSRLSNNLTKQEMVEKYNKLYDSIGDTLNNLDSAYAIRQIGMMHELLNLYRLVYSNNGNIDELKSIEELQYEVEELKQLIVDVKKTIEMFLF